MGITRVFSSIDTHTNVKGGRTIILENRSDPFVSTDESQSFLNLQIEYCVPGMP